MDTRIKLIHLDLELFCKEKNMAKKRKKKKCKMKKSNVSMGSKNKSRAAAKTARTNSIAKSY